jgi:hypothetical protein
MRRDEDMGVDQNSMDVEVLTPDGKLSLTILE